MFIFKKEDHIIILLVYVDDNILAGTSFMDFDHIKLVLGQNFKIKDLGILKYFVGLEVAHFKDGISISKRKYYLDLLNDTSLLASKSTTTPLDPLLKLHQDDSEPFKDINAYKRLIIRLIHLNNTRT